MHACQDENYASSFVKNAQKLNTEVKAKESPLSATQEDGLKEEIYRAMLYKTGGVDVGCCGGCCRKKFTNPVGSVAYQLRLFWIAFFLMICQTAVTITMSTSDALFYS
jgi:hypothetical protein